jgi:hypothetical protein
MAEKIDLVKDSTMVKMAQKLANAVRKFAPYEAIKRSVSIGKREGKGTSRFIEVKVGKPWSPGKKGAEYAAKAFDVGSGLHGKLKAKYVIRPRNKKAIWFPYADHPVAGAVTYTKNGVFGVTTKQVNHPGVKGVNYTRKAMNEVRPAIREVLKQDVGKELKLYLRTKYAKLGEK